MPSTYHIPLKKLGPLHFKIIALHLKGWKNKDIQAELAISHNTVCHTLRDSKAQALIRQYVATQLKELNVVFS